MMGARGGVCVRGGGLTKGGGAHDLGHKPKGGTVLFVFGYY